MLDNIDNQKLRQNISRLFTWLESNHHEGDEWYHAYDFSSKEYERLKYQREKVSVGLLFRLQDKFNISLEKILSGQVDYETLEEHVSGNSSYIPEQYLLAPYSNPKSLLAIFDEMEILLGRSLKAEIGQMLQVNFSQFENFNGGVNLFMVQKVFDYLNKYYLCNEQFENIGSSVVKKFQSPTIISSLEKLSSPKEMYEYFVDFLLKHIEKNWDYKIQRLDDLHMVIQSYPKEEIADVFSKKQYGSESLCSYRKGFVKSFISSLGYPDAFVIETKCIHENNSYCQYEIYFDHLNYFSPSKQLH